jgi:hypothetical protein
MEGEGKVAGLDAVWSAVLNRTYEVGEAAIGEGLVPAQDVHDQEPYLYFGLVGATILDALKRSMGKGADGVELATGRVITLSTCPAELVPLMKVLVHIKGLLFKHAVTAPEWLALRQAILWSHADGRPDPMAKIPAARVPALNSIVAAMLSVCSQVTQLDYFKQNFAAVLNLLAAAHPPPAHP